MLLKLVFVVGVIVVVIVGAIVVVIAGVIVVDALSPFAIASAISSLLLL